MAFYKIDFEVSVLGDWSDTLTLNDTVANINLAGATFDMIAIGPGGASFELSTSNGLISIVDAPNGVLAINVPAATMATLAPGTYTHQCVWVQGGQQFALWSGALIITPN